MTLTIAHRGEPIRHPENTLESLQAAVDAGAGMVEIDVRLTADGVPVLLHDADLSRIWGDPRPLSAVSVDELQRLHTPGGATIPRLEDAAELAFAAGVEMMVDLPDSAAGPVAQALMARRGFSDLALFAGETHAVRQQSATARIALTWDSLLPPDDELLAAVRPEYFNPHFQLLTASIADRMHDKGLKVSVWTVDHARDMMATIIQGADAVITNRIDELVRLLPLPTSRW